MPWSNNSGGGGWKSGGGGGGPWGQGPSGGQPPDLEEILKRGQDRLKRVMPSGGGLSSLAILLLIAGALAAWGLSGFYTVRTNEVALNLVFGKYESRRGEGLNYNWPYPIGSVIKLPVTDVRNVEIGGGSSVVDTRRSGGQLTESLMLTADENIVDIAFSVQWRISAERPQDYVFKIQNPDASIKAVAESAMREVVGRRLLKNVLPSEVPPVAAPAAAPLEIAPAPAPATPANPAAAAASAQNEILNEVRRVMQTTLNQYGAGIVIERVIITRIGPPADVLAAFTDVQAAVQERDRLQNEALTHASSVVPRARGQAKQIALEADAYRQRLIAEAQGQASRFKQVYEEYRKAPEVTRERMFLETMERVLGGTDKILIDKSPGGGGVVPYLPLNELQRRPAAQPK
jgi:membrane protease subunit HflK